MQKIQIASVKCDYKDHQGKNIKLLCLNPDCKQQSAFCFKCSIKGHLQCREFVKEPKEIEQELIDLKSLHTNLVKLSEQINQQFKTLLSKIEQLIKPITQYQQTPNLTNLNLIGSMLKQTTTTKKNIKEYTGSSLESMTSLLSNYSYGQHQNCDQNEKENVHFDQENEQVVSYGEFIEQNEIYNDPSSQQQKKYIGKYQSKN